MLHDILIRHLDLIYPNRDTAELAERICAAFALAPETPTPSQDGAPHGHWSEADSFLITYGDTILSDANEPLQNVLDFLTHHLSGVVNGVHILPFFPFTSDDGFAVSEYETIRSDLGDWSDISAIGQNYRLMSDVVSNHASASHQWFHDFLEDKAPGRDFIKTATLEDDVS